jgi:IPT/TIG domain
MKTISLLLTLLLFSAAVPAQDLPERWSVNLSGPVFPRGAMGIAKISDRDADGVADIAVGVLPTNQLTAPLPNGVVEIRSGASGALIASWPAPTAGTAFGIDLIAVDDLDGDGCEDLAVLQNLIGVGVAQYQAQVLLISAATGANLGTLPGPSVFGTHAASLQLLNDQDGDGIRELAVGSTNFGPVTTPGGVAIFDLPTATQLAFLPEASNGTTGFGVRSSTLIRVDDKNGDGIEDLVFSSSAPAAGGGNGTLELRSGADYSPLGSVASPGIPGSSSVFPIARIDDLDGDGDFELLVANGNQNALRVQSVAALPPLTVNLPVSIGVIPRANSLTSLGDIDGDGQADWGIIDEDGLLLTGSGRFLSQSSEWAQARGYDLGCRSIAPFGDLNGDGIDEFLVGIAGELRMVSFGGVRRYGQPQALDLDWRPFGVTGASLGAIEVSGATPGAPGLLALSTAEFNGTLSGTPILIDPTAPALVLTEPIGFDASGEYSVSLNLGQPVLFGIPLFLQAFEFTAGPASASNGMEFQFLPGRVSIQGFSPEGLLGGETVVVSGVGFQPGLTVELNGVSVVPSNVTSTSFTFTAPSSPDYDIDLVVRNPTGEADFATLNPTPTIGSAAPILVPAVGGARFLLGGPFTVGTSATLAGQSIPANILAEQNVLQVILPAGTAGQTLPLAIQVPGGPNGLGTTINTSISYQ